MSATYKENPQATREKMKASLHQFNSYFLIFFCYIIISWVSKTNCRNLFMLVIFNIVNFYKNLTLTGHHRAKMPMGVSDYRRPAADIDFFGIRFEKAWNTLELIVEYYFIVNSIRMVNHGFLDILICYQNFLWMHTKTLIKHGQPHPQLKPSGLK